MGKISAEYARDASLVTSTTLTENDLAVARKVSEIELAAGADATIQTIVDKHHGVIRTVRINITYVRREG